jgi:hypothetical protein
MFLADQCEIGLGLHPRGLGLIAEFEVKALLDAAVSAAEQQHRKDVADAKAELDRLPVISVDPDIVAAGVNAIMPGVEEASVTRSVVAAWVLLFSVAPCALLRLGLALLTPTRWGSA